MLSLWMGVGWGQDPIFFSCFWVFELSFVQELELFGEFSEIRDFRVL